MICTRCLLRLARRAPPKPSHAFSTTTTLPSTPVTSETTTTTNPRPEGRPAATSRPGHAQPFSTPLTPAPGNLDLPIQPNQTKAAAPRVQSSVPAGTVLKGLNFMKNKQDPVALEDGEYPDWLWGVLEKGKGDAAGGQGKGEEGDLFSKSKKQRQRAAKALRKRALQNPESLAPKVPLYEQTVDLPGGDGTLDGSKDAGQAREQLTKAMRENRRKKIKTDNFLKAMG